MTDIFYRIVEHDGGWAYKLGDVFSETFPNRQAAEAAAKRVAEEQRSPGDDESISWEDERGIWHEEAAHGADRPNAYVAGAEALQQPALAQQKRSSDRDEARLAGEWTQSTNDRGQRIQSGIQAAHRQGQSDTLLVMLLTIALAYILGIVLGRKA